MLETWGRMIEIGLLFLPNGVEATHMHMGFLHFMHVGGFHLFLQTLISLNLYIIFHYHLFHHIYLQAIGCLFDC